MFFPTPQNQDADQATTPAQVDADTSNIWETVDAMLDGFLSILPKLALGIIVFLVFWLIARTARGIIRRVTQDREKANLGQVLARLTYFALLIVGALVAVTIIAPSITPGRLLSLLGIGGVAIGFAFKDIFQNMLAGILILVREPFKVGDEIASGDYEGKVEAIETRATMIRTYDGQRVIIPNADIYTDPVTVKTAYAMIRSQYDVGIGYGDDIEQARQVMLETVQGIDGVLDDPAPDVLTWDLAGSSVNLRARWWSKPERPHVVALRNTVLQAIKEALDEAAIDMPYPTQVSLFHDQTEATDGDRTQQREGWPAGDNPPEARTIGGALHQRAASDKDQQNGTARAETNSKPEAGA